MSTRARLLETALAVFAERGTDGGSMREIARRAGVNVATTYHHFGSKRDLLLAIFRELGFLDFPKDWVTDLDPAMSQQERLEFVIFGAWMHMSSGIAVVKVMLGEALKGDAEVRSVFDEWREQGDESLRASLLATGVADETNVEHRAWVVRQLIWATFIETLMSDSLDWDQLYVRAQQIAASFLDSWQ
jgi:AcrR family transcriptional regulator